MIGLKSWSEKYVFELHSLLLSFRSSLLKIWSPQLPLHPNTSRCHLSVSYALALPGLRGSTYSQFLAARSNFYLLTTYSLPKRDVCNSVFKSDLPSEKISLKRLSCKQKKKNHFRIKFLPNLFLTLSFLLTILWHCTGFWEVPISYFTCSSLSSVSRYGRFTCEETEIFRGPVNWPGAPRWQMIEKWLSARVPVA